jgi:hypothetical protein
LPARRRRSESMPFEPGGEYFVHEGIFRAAAWIFEDCSRHAILSHLLVEGAIPGAQDWPHVHVDEEWQDCRGYQLILTGHSLGAGTATLLALLLRPQFPNLHCYAYSPPGGLLSLDAAQQTRDYVTSVVLGDDIVPRLGIRTMEQLRDHALELLMHSPSNKSSILCRALANVCCRKCLGCCGGERCCETDRGSAVRTKQLLGSGRHEDGAIAGGNGHRAQQWLQQRQERLHRPTNAKQVKHSRCGVRCVLSGGRFD